jgi:transcriptional regulator with XRE-family HTH domain
MISVTLQELACASGVSASHLGRIERGERFPSAQVVRRLAKPLGLEESELFLQAGYLSPHPPGNESEEGQKARHLDPYVASVLAKEPEEVQRVVVAILTVMKSLAREVNTKC